MHQIVTKQLYKTINGVEVLHNINITLHGGKVYGFVGKNGSGKSMLFRVLSGLVRPTSGAVFVDGQELHREISSVHKLGIVIEHSGLYPEFTGQKNLQLLASIHKLIGREEIKQAIRRVGLDPDDKRTIKNYSLGMRQRIVIAQSIMEKPNFLLLDDPTNALDEEGVELVRAIIKEEAARGALVLLASHNKEDIDSLCDKTFMMSNGKLMDGDAM